MSAATESNCRRPSSCASPWGWRCARSTARDARSNSTISVVVRFHGLDADPVQLPARSVPALNSVGVEAMKSNDREQVVELDRPRLTVDLAQREPHRDAHEERLRQLETGAADVQEITVVQRLQSEITGTTGRAPASAPPQAVQGRSGPAPDRAVRPRCQFDIGREVFAVALCHLGLRGIGRHVHDDDRTSGRSLSSSSRALT